MKSLFQTIRELEKSPDLALCLYYRSGKEKGLVIEVRTVDGGELLSQPIGLTDKLILEAGKILDPLDETSAKIVRAVRKSRTGGLDLFPGRN